MLVRFRRRWVYCLPKYTTIDSNTTIANCELIIDNCVDTPPPILFPSRVELVAENTTGKEEKVIQQQFNIESTTIQQPLNVELIENDSTVDEAKNTETQRFIQHTTKDEGERVGVEQAQSVDVLQAEPARNSSTTCLTQIETSSHTKPLNPIFTSQQESFTEKYQAVEVLNSEGEWISGYFVHKCIVVGNLKGVERKYALYDESGTKYVFWGEIRLPRVG